jgi:hypothetical protein
MAKAKTKTKTKANGSKDKARVGAIEGISFSQL